MPISINIHEHEVDALFLPAGPVWTSVEQTVNRGAALSREFCPVDEGRLRQSIHGSVERRGEALVGSWGSPLSYAIPRHEGWGLFGPKHALVRAKPGKVFVFEPSGIVVGPLKLGKRGKPLGGRKAKGKRGGPVFTTTLRGAPGSPFLTDALALVMPGVPIRKHLQF